MSGSENSNLGATRPGSPTALTDEDITTVRVDRRSFLSRAVAAGSIAAAAAMVAACASGTDSDGEGDAGEPPADPDQAADSDQATDSDRQE